MGRFGVEVGSELIRRTVHQHRTPGIQSGVSNETAPKEKPGWQRHLPMLFFLGLASFVFLESQVYFAPRSVDVRGLNLRSLDDAPVQASALQGKAVVLNFWAPWCGPCREEMPWLEDLQKTHPEAAVVGIEDDPDEYPAALALARQLNLTYALVRASEPVRKKFGHVAALPTTVYLSRSGKVVHTARGVVPESVMRHYLEDAVAAH